MSVFVGFSSKIHIYGLSDFSGMWIATVWRIDGLLGQLVEWRGLRHRHPFLQFFTWNRASE